MKRIAWFWIAAIVITLASIVFQRQTGPTYPKKVKVELDTIVEIVKLPRSSEIGKEVDIAIPSIPWDWTPTLYYRPYPTNKTWSTVPFVPQDDKFVASLPVVDQKAAKLEYYIEISNLATDEEIILPEEPIIIRYKGAVPAWALMPHILLLFVAMIFSNLAGLMAVFNDKRYKIWGVVTVLLILVGGLVFGPVVQKYAFNHYWTGFPFGSDLTDNKTLIMFVIWGVAVAANWKKDYRWLAVLAAVVTLLVYCIPHSLRGSEFDYEAGEVVTGIVPYFKSILF
ncbi:MAG: hypothetical protein ACLFNU_08955 [Bacteroidales bacterium]